MTGKLVGQLFVTGSIAAALGLAPTGVFAQTSGGPFSTGTFSCLTTSDPACPVDNSQDNSVHHTSTALGIGVQGSSATAGNNGIAISAPTQTVTTQSATDSGNGSGNSGDSHPVAVGGRTFAAAGSGGSFVALPVGGASNTGGSAPTG